jgi:hypothetical protein
MNAEELALYSKPKLHPNQFTKGFASEDERFFSKVRKTDTCWIWTGRKSGKNDYGGFNSGNKHYRTHRYSYELYFGPIPVGLEVLHKCDTPLCVNPEHLFLGTQKDNINDAKKKGRLHARFYPNDFCKNGHRIGTDGKGERVCLVCRNERSYNRYHNVVAPRNSLLKALDAQVEEL